MNNPHQSLLLLGCILPNKLLVIIGKLFLESGMGSLSKDSAGWFKQIGKHQPITATPAEQLEGGHGILPR